MTKENHPKKELTRSQIQEMELFRQIQHDDRDAWARKALLCQAQDERDYYERLKDDEPQDPDE